MFLKTLLRLIGRFEQPSIRSGLTVVENEHQLLLEALRHREEAMVQYLAILGPALGGFAWLLAHYGYNPSTKKVFVAGTIGVIALLFLGALYSLALGYNFRYIIMQLAKFEAMLGVEKYMLSGWPRAKVHFQNRYSTLCGVPWCTPPEIIGIFWKAFLACIVAVTAVACVFRPEPQVLKTLIPVAVACFAWACWIAPVLYGFKLRRMVEAEREPWTPLE